jgi:uncharacterized membrane protein YdjX (TVP38/TMEM64 family)
MRKLSASSMIKLAVLVALIAAVIYYTRFTETGRQINVLSIRESLDRVPPGLLPLAYMGVYIVGTVLMLPGLSLSFLGSLLFDLFEATLYTWIAATVGATLAFLVARFLGRDFVDRLLSGQFAALDERLRRHGFTGLLILRLVPLFPFNGINFGSGLTSIRLREYVLATALGILPGTFVYQYLFATLREKVLEQGISLSDLYDPSLLVPIGLFLFFMFAGRWLATRLKPREADVRPPS